MWKRPLDSTDNEFEDMIDPNDDSGSQHVVVATANDADAEKVTLVIVTQLEVQTTNQVFATTSSVVNPPMIWEAQSDLKDFPSAMENDSHFAVIAKKLIKDGVRHSKTIMDFIARWGPTALKGASAAAALL